MIALTGMIGFFGYIGPGAGLGLLGALFGLLLAVGSAVGFIVLWPLRQLLRKRKQAAGRHSAADLGDTEFGEEATS